MLTKVFGLTCPSLCSSQQSGDSFALCSPFLLLLPQKSPGPYPRISRWWIQPGVHPLSHQGRINCLSCLAARLLPPLAGAEGHGGSAQWALILQGGQGPLFPWAGAAPLMGLGAPGHGELLSKACTLCPCCAMTGDSSVIPFARQHRQHGAGVRAPGRRVSLCFLVHSGYSHCWAPTMAGKGPDAPILYPEMLPVLVLVLVVSWHMPGAQLRRALPGTQDSSKGSSQCPSMAQILSLAWSREFPSEWRGAAWLRQSGRAR